jgi:two-component system chemotaxis response regulator CheB
MNRMTAANIEAIVVGGSAGALDALARILPALPPTFARPVAVVLHLPPNKPSYLADVLGARSTLPVKEAEDKEPLEPGKVYVAPPNYHLLIERRGCFSLSCDEPVLFSRPAIDVLFESAADAYGDALLGVLLSGASEDGARGLARIRADGGWTLVQSPESASSRAMPEAALRLAPEHARLPSEEIGPYLARVCAGRAANTETR